MFCLVLYEDAFHLLELGVKSDGCLLNVIESFEKMEKMEKKTNLVKRLLERGADPNEEWKKNKSILSAAIERNMSEIAEELIKHGADVNFTDSKGANPLGYAIQLCKSGWLFLSQIINLVCSNLEMYTSFFHILNKPFKFLIKAIMQHFFRLEIIINVYVLMYTYIFK